MKDLQKKLLNPTIVSPNKVKSINSSTESLVSNDKRRLSVEPDSAHSKTIDASSITRNKLYGSSTAQNSPKKLKTNKSSAKDPISRILKVNQRNHRFKDRMNKLLLRILQRYELDKPILMRDKLDAIWDKRVETPEVPKPV